MSFDIIIYIIEIIFIVLLMRFIYVMYYNHELTPRNHYSTIKTLIILGSGGHTAEMLRIARNLEIDKYTPRVYVCAQTDEMSVRKLNDIEVKNSDWTHLFIYRSREVGQSYLTSIFSTLIAFKDALFILLSENPDLILCNGPGTGVPLCLGAFFLRLLFLGKSKIIFIESFCRVKTYSLTGKILYYFANYVIVQWPQLSTADKHVHVVY